MVALRCLEDFIAPQDGITSDAPSAAGSKVQFDLSESCQDVLQRILQEVKSFYFCLIVSISWMNFHTHPNSCAFYVSQMTKRCVDYSGRIPFSQTSVSNLRAAGLELSKWDIHPFIRHKRACMPKCALEQVGADFSLCLFLDSSILSFNSPLMIGFLFSITNS